ncbi:hypothetical protein [Fluviicola sp.]|uniref:hypothetical protein n=1 Tax=Fluviicola sp. TaxID=1917219 RepID=UPI00262D2A41|nr:hypothetical protein [Fluviicola sp.]
MRLFFTGLCFVSMFGYSQSGYLNQKNLASVELFGNSPLILNTKLPQYRFEKEKMVERKEWLNGGGSIYYIRVLSKKIGFGVEANIKNLKVIGPKNFSISNNTTNVVVTDTTWLRTNPFNVNCYTFMTRLEVYNKLGNGPIGLAHVIGLGFSLSKAIDKTYYYSLNEFGTQSTYEDYWSAPDKFYLEKKWPLIKSIVFQYGVQMRYPLGSRFSLNFGIKSLINIALRIREDRIVTNDNDPYRLDNLFYNLRKENAFSLNLNAGLSYHF